MCRGVLAPGDGPHFIVHLDFFLLALVRKGLLPMRKRRSETFCFSSSQLLRLSHSNLSFGFYHLICFQ
ncbi:hypothetical protein HZ326_5327 [Fusarium oxysporum f. sp. albedinis]|nr:hypothetical protein HZ326_5327 [Fusarium oxysporum f. sp. albedinis]